MTDAMPTSRTVPSELHYTAEHEWIAVQSSGGEPLVLRVGITDFAQDALGDVVYVDLGQIGTAVTAGEPFGEVESTKSVSDLYAPVTGVITAHNPALESEPETVNRDPYGDGWLVELTVENMSSVDTLLDSTLLDATEYGKLLSDQAIK